MLWVADLLEFAVVDMELSPAEFWDLSWHEWGLFVMRYNKQVEKEKAAWENQWHQFRMLLTLTNNAHFKKALKPTDFIKLSFDKEDVKKVSVPLSPEEVEKKFGTKGKTKKKNG